MTSKERALKGVVDTFNESTQSCVDELAVFITERLQEVKKTGEWPMEIGGREIILRYVTESGEPYAYEITVPRYEDYVLTWIADDDYALGYQIALEISVFLALHVA